MHDKELRSNPALPKDQRNSNIAPSVNPYNHQEHLYSKNQPENLEFLARFRTAGRVPGETAVGEVGDAQRGLVILGQYTAGNTAFTCAMPLNFWPKTHSRCARGRGFCKS